MKVYYSMMFILSLIMTGIYAGIWRKRFSVFITLIFAFVPITCLGYFILAFSKTVPEATIGIKFSYMACFIHIFLMYAIFNLCNLNLKKWLQMLLLAVSTIFFLFALTIGSHGFFYKELTGELIDNQLILHKTYGFVHTLYYIQLFIYMAITISATVYAIKKKNDVSRHNLHYMLTCEIIPILIFFTGKLFHLKVDLLPLAYISCEIVLLIISRRIVLYDVTETVIETIAFNGKTGFVSFDDGFHYLGSNDFAKKIYPELAELKVDDSVLKNPELNKGIISKVREYIINPKKNSFFIFN